MNNADKATKVRFALIEEIGRLNAAGSFRQAADLERVVDELSVESRVRLYDIIHDATYDPLGTFGRTKPVTLPPGFIDGDKQ